MTLQYILVDLISLRTTVRVLRPLSFVALKSDFGISLERCNIYRTGRYPRTYEPDRTDGRDMFQCSAYLHIAWQAATDSFRRSQPQKLPGSRLRGYWAGSVRQSEATPVKQLMLE